MLKKVNCMLGLAFIGVMAVALFDLDDKLMEMAEPYLKEIVKLKASAAQKSEV